MYQLKMKAMNPKYKNQKSGSNKLRAFELRQEKIWFIVNKAKYMSISLTNK